jgi:hypothetical protein
MVVFAVEHWLISQSMFVIRTLVFDWDGTPLPGRTTSGHSVIPALIGTCHMYFFNCLGEETDLGAIALILGFVAFLGYIINSFLRRYNHVPGMPLVSTCSLAISANCHRPAEDTDAHLLPVMWGVYDKNPSGGAKCAFTTSRYVRKPDMDEVLLGLPAQKKVESGRKVRQRFGDWKRSVWTDWRLRKQRKAAWERT